MKAIVQERFGPPDVLQFADTDPPEAGDGEAGKLTPVLDRTYPLADTAEGLRRVEQGHARGKVVITVV